MYDLINQIIGHSWNGDYAYSTEQQIVYYICGSLILLLTVVFIDLIYRLVRSVLKKGEF